MRNIQTAVSSHPLKTGHMLIWTYLLGKKPYYHLLKHKAFHLKHPVYSYIGLMMARK